MDLGGLSSDHLGMGQLDFARRQRIERVSQRMLAERLSKTGLAAGLRRVHARVLAQLPRGRLNPVAGHQFAHRGQIPCLSAGPLSRQLDDTTQQITASQRLQPRLRDAGSIDERTPHRALCSGLILGRITVEPCPVRHLVLRRPRLLEFVNRTHLGGCKERRIMGRFRIKSRAVITRKILDAVLNKHGNRIHMYAHKHNRSHSKSWSKFDLKHLNDGRTP